MKTETLHLCVDDVAFRVGQGGTTRSRIMAALDEPRTCYAIAQELGLHWSTIAQHLEKLEAHGYITRVRFGKRDFFRRNNFLASDSEGV